MERLLIDALDTIPLEDALELNVDSIDMTDLGIFDLSVNSEAAKVLSSPKQAQTAVSLSYDEPRSVSNQEMLTTEIETLPRKQINASRKRQREEMEYLRAKKSWKNISKT
ncbi:unnamed protein product [Aphanomyces euteiches]|uniref:Uncharacterized protein n=1 Tax=Aphanomyces euteiches TaxID=100861 RepID=A0A6G0XA49_9STRA|nr:hypothetical protein Ae201684_006795 [Aphanomyces euteiches]KAH9087040.1 hypothetical protein Ae201684P_000454 [Aphanomyces euteiches]KAH9142883.1 hypothetical protein AeRB84_013079 [Aphanomyces euteiches]